ncbi:hypothetical protein LCGC14_3034850 [marine sediment metagenome]|uniref:RNA polymerase sigma-70 ECF-like HTH domain-containing protein n=1 Tax=marine sediment metagenome TaxID=412755 RepID=A0A0F8WRX2_9ZZZZ
MSDKSNNELVVAAEIRRNEIAKVYLDGITNQVELANKFNVSQTTIHRDLAYLRKRWSKESSKSVKKERAVSIKHLYSVAEKAMESYEISRENAEEITTSIRQDDCRKCNGKGIVNELECLNCDGKGKVEVKTETKKIKGQAGDSSFLAEFRKCIEQIIKLKGLYKERKTATSTNVSGQVIHSHVNGNRFKDATPEQILEAMKIIHRLGDSTSTNESDVIDVEVESE